MLRSCQFCCNTSFPKLVNSVIILLITYYNCSHHLHFPFMTSNSQLSLAPIYLHSKQINECIFRDDLPEDFALIHSTTKDKKLFQNKSREKNIHHFSTPSIQRSVNIDAAKQQLALKTTQSNRNECSSAKKLFYSNSAQQKTRIGMEKWKIMNNTTKPRSTNEKTNDKRASVYDEETSQNWLQDISTNPGLYTVVCRPLTSIRKEKQSWVGRFLKKGNKKCPKNTDSTRIEENDDSFELINANEPGPTHYDQNITKKQSLNIKNTFGTSKRFISEKRPMTAEIGYHQSNTLLKKVDRNEMQNVSFGTSKNNPRSQVAKIEYCQWYRSHCCESTPDLVAESLKDYNNTANHFASAVARFPDPPKKYDGPDFYSKVKVKRQKSHTPAHYFISDVKKGLPEIDQEKEKQNNKPKNTGHEMRMKSKKPTPSYQMCLKQQNIKKQNWFGSGKVNSRQNQLERQIQPQQRKNNIGNGKRIASPKKHSPVEKCDSNKIKIDDENWDSPPQREGRETCNNWIKKSFNVKFQYWE